MNPDRLATRSALCSAHLGDRDGTTRNTPDPLEVSRRLPRVRRGYLDARRARDAGERRRSGSADDLSCRAGAGRHGAPRVISPKSRNRRRLRSRRSNCVFLKHRFMTRPRPAAAIPLGEFRPAGGRRPPTRSGPRPRRAGHRRCPRWPAPPNLPRALCTLSSRRRAARALCLGVGLDRDRSRCGRWPTGNRRPRARLRTHVFLCRWSHPTHTLVRPLARCSEIAGASGHALPTLQSSVFEESKDDSDA